MAKTLLKNPQCAGDVIYAEDAGGVGVLISFPSNPELEYFLSDEMLIQLQQMVIERNIESFNKEN